MPRRLQFLIKILLAVAIGCAFRCCGQAPVPMPITGNLGSIIGYGQPYAGMFIQLQNCPAPAAITGYWGIVQNGYQLQANSAGLINSTIWPNDLITCNGTTGTSQYAVTYMVNGQPTGPATCYQPVSSLGVWNINMLQPITCTQTPPNPQDQTWNNLTLLGFFSGVGGSFSGNLAVGGALTNTGMIYAHGGITLGTLPTACTGSNFMVGLSLTLQPVCTSLPTAPIISFNGRGGAVVPVANDYSYSMIANAPSLYFNSIAATFRSKWNFSQRFIGTDASPNTNIDLNAPGTGNYIPTETANPGSSTNLAQYDGNGNLAPCTTGCVPGFTSGNNTNGYWVKDPVGHIHQWGTVSCTSANPCTITFPTAFASTAGLVCVAISYYPGGDTGYHTVDSSSPPTTTTCSLHQNNLTSMNAMWTADGY